MKIVITELTFTDEFMLITGAHYSKSLAKMLEKGISIGLYYILDMVYIKKRKKLYIMIIVVLTAILLCGCESATDVVDSIEVVTDATMENINLPYVIETPGVLTQVCPQAEIDYSNTSKGYVAIKCAVDVTQRMKAQIEGPNGKYTYDVKAGELAVLPLTGGNGTYTITVYENVEGSKYAQILSASYDVVLENEFYPFLYPNKFVNYINAPNAIATAYKICESAQNEIEVIDKIYLFVSRTITYDHELAASVKSDYVPDVDDVLSRKSGICFDYAALMASMLRSVNIPTKVVFGYADEIYHAWVSVYTKDEGWLENIAYFDGKSWQRVDPTMSGEIESGQEMTYTEKLFY